MKKVLVFVWLMLVFGSTYSQSTDVRGYLSSGLFSFVGESARNSSIIIVSRDGDGYTNSPYGRESELSFGISVGITQVYRSNFIIKTDLGYELLRSQVEITDVSSSGLTTGFGSLLADGQTYLNNNFINVFSGFGYRLALAAVSIDFSVGTDVAYCISAREKGKAEAGTREYRTQRSRKTIDIDLRPRFQVDVHKGKYGIYAGYSRGLRNYKSGFDGGVNEAYSKLVRFGLSYKLI